MYRLHASTDIRVNVFTVVAYVNGRAVASCRATQYGHAVSHLMRDLAIAGFHLDGLASAVWAGIV